MYYLGRTGVREVFAGGPGNEAKLQHQCGESDKELSNRVGAACVAITVMSQGLHLILLIRLSTYIPTIQICLYTGFHTGFFLGGERLCGGKLIRCGHRPQPPRGVWGHAPQEKFWNFNFLGHDSWGGETEVKGGKSPFPRVLYETLLYIYHLGKL